VRRPPVRVFLHICPARQRPVEAVHQHGDDHPHDHHAVVAFENGKDGEQAPDRAGGGEQMHAPRGDHTKKVRFLVGHQNSSWLISTL
jgi:hypothetical protein